MVFGKSINFRVWFHMSKWHTPVISLLKLPPPRGKYLRRIQTFISITQTWLTISLLLLWLLCLLSNGESCELYFPFSRIHHNKSILSASLSTILRFLSNSVLRSTRISKLSERFSGTSGENKVQSGVLPTAMAAHRLFILNYRIETKPLLLAVWVSVL